MRPKQEGVVPAQNREGVLADERLGLRQLANIGERIHSMVDLVIDGNEYVHSIQSNESEETRYEQGVMLSFVDDQGKLLADGQAPYPMLIRRGLDCDKIMSNMSKLYNSWDYRHGAYH